MNCKSFLYTNAFSEALLLVQHFGPNVLNENDGFGIVTGEVSTSSVGLFYALLSE